METRTQSETEQEHPCHILAKNALIFCVCHEILKGDELKDDSLIYLAEEISRDHIIQVVV